MVTNVVIKQNSFERILVIKLRHFGDVLLITPLLTTLQQHAPNAKIDVLLYSGTEKILSKDKTIHHFWTIDRQLKRAGIKAQILGEWALFQSLKKQNYSLILNLSDQWRSAFYARFLKPQFSIGFHYAKRDNALWFSCYDHLVPVSNHVKQHTVINNLSILDPLKLSKISTRVSMSYGSDDIFYVEKILHERLLSDYILIHPFARWHFKTWSAAYFSQLINYLTAQREKIVITGGPEKTERDYVLNVIEYCNQKDEIVNLVGLVSFSQLAVLIDRAQVFIGVDSVAMHMAAALKTPSVVLFGPSNIKQWHPWNAPYTLLWAGDHRELPFPWEVDTSTSDRYLDAIPLEKVIDAVDFWRAQHKVR
ncbi:putative lipopolysaccharide heptosyltransferase III [Candidatus Williamhamiltonella defendens]|uniref:putative lipopolysaccharide heptosyltransferase III n=1 Tax=Candidatus Williamhamiltonella defendens TaxID=138072 RepID=UPI0016517AC0|nr:putative lipopolysaccharide heptosyltransferase III [Candidatus Hamiltonella defensa]